MIGTGAVNEIKGGASLFNYTRDSAVTWQGGCFPDAPVRCGGSQTITLRGYSIGSAVGQDQTQNNYSIRDDFTFSFDKGGRQDVKIGGEYIYQPTYILWCATCTGSLDASNGRRTGQHPIALPGVERRVDLEPRAAVADFEALHDECVEHEVPLQDPAESLRRLAAGRLEGDQPADAEPRRCATTCRSAPTPRGTVFTPWINDDIPYDLNNFGPRFGFAYTIDDKTVIRGGYGLFYAQASTDEGHQTEEAVHQAAAEILYDGRADFASNPFNGPAPTYAQVMANACDQNGNAPGCYRRSITDEINSKWRRMPYARQGSIGLQRQVGSDMSLQANYVYTGGRGEESVPTSTSATTPPPARTIRQPTSPTVRSRTWGVVPLGLLEGYSNYHGLETSFNKRFSHRWQAQGTYTLSAFRDGNPQPDMFSIVDGSLTRTPYAFPIAKDIGGDYGLATTDQRHRAVFNGIYSPGLGIQVSGLYFYGSGSRMATRYGSDVRDVGFGGMATQRLRPDGSIIPRNNFVGLPLHRVDMRVQKSITLGRRVDLGECRRVQPAQSGELRLLHVDRDERGVHQAVLQQQPRLPGADGAVRVQACVLSGR